MVAQYTIMSVLLKPPAEAKVCGDAEGWCDAAGRHQEFLRRDMLQLLGELKSA